VIEKAHDALAFDDARGTVARALSPLRYLVKPHAMLDSRAVNGNHKFGHQPYFWGKFVGAEFGNRKRYSLVEGFRLHFNIMRDAVGIRKRDPAAIHGRIIAVVSSFVRLRYFLHRTLYLDEIERQGFGWA
jgi:hypothetical protein